jgi:hypothetical protein
MRCANVPGSAVSALNSITAWMCRSSDPRETIPISNLKKEKHISKAIDRLQTTRNGPWQSGARSTAFLSGQGLAAGRRN